MVWSVLVLLCNVREQDGFWRLVFTVFSLIAVTLDIDIVISRIQNLSFGRPGASIFHPGSRCVSLGRPGGPWEQQERHVGLRRQMTESTPRVIGVAVGKR